MARVIYPGTSPTQRRSGGAVLYTSPQTPLQRQGPVPASPRPFQTINATNGLIKAAYIWTQVLSPSDRAGWAAAAIAPLTGYTYFLKLALPTITFLGVYPPAPYTPANVSGFALANGWTDTTLNRAFISYFGDLGTTPPAPLYLALYIRVSDLFTAFVSAASNTPGRYVRNASPYVAFGVLGPLVLNEYAYADVTAAVQAVYGQLPANFFYPNAQGYQQGGRLSCLGTYMTTTGYITTLNSSLKFGVTNGWAPPDGYVMGHPPSTLLPFVNSPRTDHLAG